jgi:hypothetical protein
MPYTDSSTLTIHGVTQTLAEHEAANVISVQRKSGAIVGFTVLSSGDNGSKFSRQDLSDSTEITIDGRVLTIAAAEAAGLIAVRRNAGEVTGYVRLSGTVDGSTFSVAQDLG